MVVSQQVVPYTHLEERRIRRREKVLFRTSRRYRLEWWLTKAASPARVAGTGLSFEPAYEAPPTDSLDPTAAAPREKPRDLGLARLMHL